MFNAETIKILLIFFPGLVGFIFIHFSINTHNKINITLGFLFSFVLGVFSYLSLSFFSFIPLLKTSGNLLEMSFSQKDIGFALLFSMIYSLIIIKIIDKEIIHSCLRKMNILKTVGAKHIIDSLYTSTDEELLKLKTDLVDIRFQNKNLTYSGNIRLINIIDNGLVEILLENAGAVYDDKSDFSYMVKSVIICEKLENIIVEYRNQ